MHYYMYQITNKVNGKIYVGVHKTKSLDDGYMGSGKVIQRAIAKHGAENFEKVILEHFENQDAMYAKEAEIVNEEFLAREDTYNLRRGGFGGFDYIAKHKLAYNFTDKDREKAKPLLKIAFIQMSDEKLKERSIKIVRSKKLNGTPAISLNAVLASRTESANEKRIASARKIAEVKHGVNHHCFNTCWIYNDIESKKIQKEELNLYLSDGWIKGRKIRFDN